MYRMPEYGAPSFTDDTRMSGSSLIKFEILKCTGCPCIDHFLLRQNPDVRVCWRSRLNFFCTLPWLIVQNIFFQWSFFCSIFGISSKRNRDCQRAHDSLHSQLASFGIFLIVSVLMAVSICLIVSVLQVWHFAHYFSPRKSDSQKSSITEIHPKPAPIGRSGLEDN